MQYNPEDSIENRIYYLKHHETYDGSAINKKLYQVMEEIKSNYKTYLPSVEDAILYTRNIHKGRGLRDLTYSYLYTLQHFIPMKAVFTLYIMVNEKIGSWRDIRNYCEFLAAEKGRNEIFVRPIICLYNHQLIKDNAKWKQVLDEWSLNPSAKPRPDARDHISYAAKWVPRESKGRAWLFDILVSLYTDPEYKAIRESAKTPEQVEAAIRKCKMMYRKMVSNLNKELDIVEIKQCANKWAEINPDKLSTSQMFNGASAFTQRGTEDRDKCASTFDLAYKTRLELIAKKKYSYNVPVWKLVKHMARLVQQGKKDEIEAMNLHWESYVENRMKSDPNYYVVMIDISETMSDKQLYTAIGMACATKSHFGKKVLVIGTTPQWVDLSDCEFSVMVQRIMSQFWNKTAAINDAFKIILDAVVSAKMTPEDVANMKIQLYSNNTIDYEGISEMWRPFVLDENNFYQHK